LPDLAAWTVPIFDRSKFELHVSQSKMMMHFDTVYQLDGVQYQVICLPNAAAVPVASHVPLTRYDPRTE
jgi:hypothetical protein